LLRSELNQLQIEIQTKPNARMLIYKETFGLNAGNSGVKLQYTHSRLSSLVEAATVSLKNSDVTSIDTTSLQESIALELVIT
jgi:arginyl-tRNA synthetase